MAETTIGNLTLGTVDGTTLFEQERTVNGSQVSEKVLSSSVANFVGTSAQFAGLSTTAKNLVGAINEAAQSGGGASVIQLTQAEYTALSTAEKMNGSIYKLTDKALMLCLDEEYHPVKELTTAQYNALTTAQQNNGTIYIQTDAETTGEDIPVNTLTPNTSVNSAINACFGRTGSDIPVSTGETETIAEAIDEAIYADGTYQLSGICFGYGSGSSGNPNGVFYLPKKIPSGKSVTISNPSIALCRKYDGTNVAQTSASAAYSETQNYVAVGGNVAIGYYVSCVMSVSFTMTIS